ncbi:uncharacterized protein C24H6.02c-like [Trichogramma pretiosum]|uniref:uncharacterized protein C24H6.02c-like n=1 Tax=Trichogramma pretiosum TaxID=7493 RepID=UPI0006C99F89|nr:uncharacterized protein C24H6.02c-like [Trichogramma pretiosum]
MFIVRQLSSVGLRTTLRLSQENARSINIKSLASSVLIIDKSVVNTSQMTSTTFEAKRPEVSDSVREAEKFLKEKFETLEVDFPCPKCNTINYQVVTKRAHEKGFIMVLCPGCRHNIVLADNLGYFKSNGEGEFKNCPVTMRNLLHPENLKNLKINIKRAQEPPKDAIQEGADLYYYG